MFKNDEFSRKFCLESYRFKSCFIILLLPLILPLIYYLGFFFWIDIRFELLFIRTTAFQILVSIAFLSYIVLILREKRYQPFFNTTHFLLIILGLVLVISSLMSLDIGASLMGTSGRADGLLLLGHVGAYFFLLSWIIRDKIYLEFIFKIAIFSGVLTILSIPLILFFKPAASMNFTYWYANVGVILGNPNFLAHYLLLLLLMNSYFILTNIRLWNLAVSLLLFLIIILSGSSTAFLTAISLLLVLLWIVLRKAFYFISLSGFGLWLYLLLTGNAVLNSLTDTIWASFLTRWKVWESAVWVVIKSSAWFGFGWGNNEIMWNFAEQDYAIGQYSVLYQNIFDKMHNIIVEYFTAAGFIGLIIFLIFFGRIIFVSVRNFVKKRGRVWLFLALSFSFNLFFLLFNFDTLMSYILICLFLTAFLVFTSQTDSSVILPRRKVTAPLILVGLAVVFVAFQYSYKPLRVYLLVEQAQAKINFYSLEFTRDAQQIFPFLDQALDIKQPKDLLLKDVAQTYNLIQTRIRVSPQEREHIYNQMKNIYLTLIGNHPFNPYYYYTLASIEKNYKGDFIASEGYLKQALTLAPHKILFRHELALNYLGAGKYDEAKLIINKLIADGFYPEKMDFYLILIDVHQKEFQEVEQRLIKNLALYKPASSEWNYLAAAYAKEFGQRGVLSLYERIIHIGEPNIVLYAAIINLARNLDETDLAGRYYQEAMLRMPDSGNQLFLSTVKSTLKSKNEE